MMHHKRQKAVEASVQTRVRVQPSYLSILKKVRPIASQGVMLYAQCHVAAVGAVVCCQCVSSVHSNHQCLPCTDLPTGVSSTEP